MPTKAPTRPRPDKVSKMVAVDPARPNASAIGSIESYASKPVPFLKAKAWHCRAVLDERGSDGLAMFCGARVINGHPWCEHHLIRFTTPRGRG